MTYFLINNNYHLIDLSLHYTIMQNKDISLIQIPHTLEVLGEDDRFRNIYTFQTPFKELKNYFNPFKVKQSEKEINNQLNLSKNDTLFVYTEYELLNQYIIAKFKNCGAKVYVIEEGFMTYNTYSISSDNKLNLKMKIKLFYLKYILSYEYVEFLFFNNIVFPQINEKYIDGILLYFDVPISRNIQKYMIKKVKNKIFLDETKTIFLNEKMYDYYCTKDEHEVILHDILLNLSKLFLNVYFKFHPSETEKNINWQLEIIEHYPNIIIIKDKSPIEDILEQYNAKYIFSYFSVALLNVYAMNATPIYIFHKYKVFSNSVVLNNVQNILKSFGYNFLKNYEEFSEVGFKSISNINKYILDDILKLNKER